MDDSKITRQYLQELDEKIAEMEGNIMYLQETNEDYSNEVEIYQLQDELDALWAKYHRAKAKLEKE